MQLLLADVVVAVSEPSCSAQDDHRWWRSGRIDPERGRDLGGSEALHSHLRRQNECGRCEAPAHARVHLLETNVPR